MELSDIATDYIPTTTVAVSVGPVANLPRLNYPINSDGSVGCPSLLLEPQRTNLALYSEQLNLWIGSNVTITSNTSQSPDGYQNADNVNITATNGYWQRGGLTFANSTSYAASVFVKKSATTGTKTFRFYYNNNVGAPNNGEWKCVVDLTNITATTTPSGTAVTGAPTILSTNLVDYGNDWYRVEVAFTTGSSAGNSSSEIGFLANGVVVDFDAYGPQVEAGSYATSYIPTLGAAVTRAADSCSKTGISSLIGQTEGTLFAEVEISNNALGWILDVSDGTTTNRTLFFKLLNNQIRFVRDSVTQSSSTSLDSPILSLGVHKIALAYQSGNTAFFIDGVQISTTNTATFTNGTLNKISLGTAGDGSGNQLGDRISQALLFKTRLTNAQLVELTTL
jgi:hypothetical protein